MQKTATAAYSQSEFRDIDFFSAYALLQLDGRVIQLDPGPLHIDIRQIAFQDLHINYFTTSKTIATEDFRPRRWTSFYLCPPRFEGECNWCGCTVQPHTLAIARPLREHFFKVPAGWYNIEFAVLDDLLIQLGIFTDVMLKRFMAPEKGHISLPGPNAERLLRWLCGIFSDVKAIDAIRNDPIQAQLLRQTILDELTQALRLGMENPQRKIAVRPNRRYDILRQALNYIKDRQTEYLTVKSLSKETGINRKKLERSFRDVLGISPYQFLLRERLNAARLELLSLPCLPVVTEMALKYGFSSGSEFASHYKRFYGESPSETLCGIRYN